MGKCLSCLKENSLSHNSNTQSIRYHPTKSENDTTKRVSSESSHSVNGLDGRSAVLTADVQSIGSGKNSVGGLCVGAATLERRTFYSRIPPLAKCAGQEVKRLTSREYSEAKIHALFDVYKDERCDVILSEGIERLCLDLDVKPDDFKVLVLAWKFCAETMCRFTRDEFVTGCREMRVDSVRGILGKLPELVGETRDPEAFRQLYRFTYKFGLDVETGQRNLPMDMAVCLWRLVFSLQEPPVLRRWLLFLESHQNVRCISRDTWNMFLNFAEVVGDDLGSYDDTEAWPSLFDDFVEYENDKLNQNFSDKPLKDDSDSV